MLRLLLGVEVVEVAEELVEAVHRRQELVLVAEVVLAELAGGVAERLERLGDRDVLGAQAEVGGRQPDLGEARAQGRLAGDEGRAARRAALLGVVVGEHHAFAGDAVDVRRAVAHQAERIGADVGLADIVAEDDEDVRPPARRRAAWAAAAPRDCAGAAVAKRRRGRRARCRPAAVRRSSDAAFGPGFDRVRCSVAHGSLLSLTTQRNPTWLVEVSTGCA